jgi:hypothetical protein
MGGSFPEGSSFTMYSSQFSNRATSFSKEDSQFPNQKPLFQGSAASFPRELSQFSKGWQFSERDIRFQRENWKVCMQTYERQASPIAPEYPR